MFILAKSWTELYSLARRLRDYGVKVVGPGARPYRRSRLFASLAKQLGAAVTDGHRYNVRQLERAMFNAIQDMTGTGRWDIFGYDGRRTMVALMRTARVLADYQDGVNWMEIRASRQTVELVTSD